MKTYKFFKQEIEKGKEYKLKQVLNRPTQQILNFQETITMFYIIFDVRFV